jgi:hypothetical protein
MDPPTTISPIFSRKSKIIWKPNLNLNIGMADLDNFTLHETHGQKYELATIALEEYIIHGVVLVIVLLILLVSYICFWKWVAKGNLDLPKFGGGSQLVFNCFPRKSGLSKSESTQVLQYSQEHVVVPDLTGNEEKDSTDILEFHCDND